MIKRINDFTGINGGFPPFMPVIKADMQFAADDADGAYIQKENEEASLLISLRGVTATLVRLSEAVNIEELVAFLEFRQVKNILSDFVFEGFDFEKRAVMKATPLCNIIGDAVAVTPASRLSEYKYIFSLLSSGGSFEAWYPTFSRKINNDSACGVYIVEGDMPVSCAVAPFVSDGEAVIAGVQTEESYRGKGYATRCIKVLLSELNHKNIDNVYLWCEDKNIKLYENTGFALCGEIYVKKEE